MPLDPCVPCGCDPGQLITDSRRANDTVISRILCQILAALPGAGPGLEGTRYDWEVLCDPLDGRPVFVRWQYATDGTLVSSSGFYADGTDYPADLNALLVECVGTRYDWEVLCDPADGRAVFVRWEYAADGTITSSGFYADNTDYLGDINTLLVNCAPAPEPVPLVEAAFQPLVGIGAAGIPDTYTYPFLVLAGGFAREVVIHNETNEELFASFDGAASDNALLPSGSIRTFSFASLGVKVTQDVWIRHSVTAPTTGSVYLEIIK